MPNPSQNWLLRAKADLTPAIIAKAIAKRLKKLGCPATSWPAWSRASPPSTPASARDRAEGRYRRARALVLQRLPAQHQHPRARGLARCGRHWLPLHDGVDGPQYQHLHADGRRGRDLGGQAPFTRDAHVFANLGDGTYFHSGLLAIRQSIAAGVNITYKILYNDAVAMTGGQQVGERPEGHSVLQIMHSVKSEGAVKIVIVTDEPQKYDGVPLADGVTVHHRDELDRIQRELREIQGCTC